MPSVRPLILSVISPVRSLSFLNARVNTLVDLFPQHWKFLKALASIAATCLVSASSLSRIATTPAILVVRRLH